MARHVTDADPGSSERKFVAAANVRVASLGVLPLAILYLIASTTTWLRIGTAFFFAILEIRGFRQGVWVERDRVVLVRLLSNRVVPRADAVRFEIRDSKVGPVAALLCRDGRSEFSTIGPMIVFDRELFGLMAKVELLNSHLNRPEPELRANIDGASPAPRRMPPFDPTHRSPADGVDLQDRPDMQPGRVTPIAGGRPLMQLSRRGGWVEVVTATGLTGWCEESAIESIGR